ncbi:MAG: hypothetical protein HKN21_15805 [Candidatus Eisenbacteria bacterium]|uniref:Sigma-70 family RNA polymerase sigma factor n=1 Tax=Eiseniibacteriota bacterium TaxID=2212470 RepID=A0A7Y2H3Y2_UNCEI|nr:hypothetical protein [Candidatus Eisenbacteria bacterium]
MTELPLDPFRSEPENQIAAVHVVNRDKDKKLVEAILAQSEEAWHEFIQRFTGLMYTVLKRHIQDEEHLRTAYVELLESLYRKKFATYEGRASLATWLTFVARNHALDAVRSRFGRQHSETLNRLTEQDRRVFELYYYEKMSLRLLRKRLATLFDPPPSLEDVLNSLERIDSTVDTRVFRRIALQNRASELGLASGRQLAYRDMQADEISLSHQARNPEEDLIKKEAEHRTHAILDLVDELPAQDQKLLRLRFTRGLKGREVAEGMGLKNPKHVYRMLERSLKRLRRLAQQHDLL